VNRLANELKEVPAHLKKTFEHHKDGTAWQRFNLRVALKINNMVFTMNTFWVFCVLALCSLPSVLSGFTIFAGVFPSWMIKVSIIALIAWIAQTFIQLVLLPAIGVNQNVQAAASDVRNLQMFNDLETVKSVQAEHSGKLDQIIEALHDSQGPSEPTSV
jgi:hypothetical protein